MVPIALDCSVFGPLRFADQSGWECGFVLEPAPLHLVWRVKPEAMNVKDVRIYASALKRFGSC